jgi:uncharacterized membrane protein SirB2
VGLIEFYAQIRLLHIGCATASGSLFALRGLLALAGSRHANHLALRVLSWAIDTALLTAALMLVDIIHQYPLADAWLTVKVALLVPYVVLAALTLRRARTQRTRTIAFAGTLVTFLCIVTVAHWHDPLGPLRWLVR